MSDRDLFHAVVFTSVIQLHFIPNCWWFFSTASLLGASTMQNALFSPAPGRVDRVLVASGDTIDRGATLVELNLDGAGAP